MFLWSDVFKFCINSVKIDKSNLYAVTMGVYDSYSEAEKVALGSSIQGASGYIWQDSDRYYVIGNIYYTKDECNKVIENLSNTNYKVDVLNIEFPKLKLNFDMYENSDMAVVNDAMNIFDDVYDDIYSNSIKFDKGEISHLAVSSNVSQIRGKLKNIIISTQGLINNKSSDLNIVQGYLVELDEVLNQTILKTIDNTSTGYSLKYAIANVVRLKFDMFNKLC